MAAVALTFMLLLLMSPSGQKWITPSQRSVPTKLYVGRVLFVHLHVDNKAESFCMTMPPCMLTEL